MSGKKAYFTDSMVRRLFKALKGRTITVVIKGEVFIDVHIAKDAMPLEFEIDKKDNKFILSQKQNMPIALSKDGEFFFYEGKIYELPKDQREAYLPFYNRFKE